MRAAEFFAVFPAVIKSDWSDFSSKTFHEELKVSFFKVPVFGKVFVVVGQGDEAVRIMHLGFVYTANCPFLRLG